jgi:hypothetical protein
MQNVKYVGKIYYDECIIHENDIIGDYSECYCNSCWIIGKNIEKILKNMNC